MRLSWFEDDGPSETTVVTPQSRVKPYTSSVGSLLPSFQIVLSTQLVSLHNQS